MEELVNLHIGKRLRSRRKTLGLTQSDVGAMTGMRFRQIHKYESGENKTSAAVLWKLACALDVNIHYFFEGLRDVPSVAPRGSSADGDAAETLLNFPAPANRQDRAAGRSPRGANDRAPVGRVA
ncbi:MAG TPA: helix-turn-helix transcriptional regulator [Phenylobacterium sp.]|jgi:transcriptional regulator with XRE-family HTH domain|uniref:helix-turn-helix domain-containing protein n=1 Tax=Phenylobacterium sp. TaxID=1871053 RepID=UPI002D55A89D|nr:helix-turn-helix transcriptional regulator [Phenylobacterium sp.]HZZ70351.1 helix-turn-helix transcriptional regulator [Phenylobacterium sp.]